MAQTAYPTSDITVGTGWGLVPTLTGSAKASGTTITLPAHVSGNVLVIAARRNASATAPSLPAGWTSVTTAAGGSAVSLRVGYKVAASSAETSGTWTNATDLIAFVLFGGAAVPLGAVTANSAGTTSLSTLTGAVVDGSSVSVGFVGGSTASTVTAPLTQTTSLAVYNVAEGDVSTHAGAILNSLFSNTAATWAATSGGSYCTINSEFLAASTAARFYLALNEVAQSDTEYVVGTSTSGALEVDLGTLTDPVSATGHIIHYAARSLNGAAGGESFKVELIENATIRATSGTVSANRTVFTAGTYTLSSAEANAITDYTNLRLRFTPVVIGSGEAIAVSWANFEVPDATSARRIFITGG